MVNRWVILFGLAMVCALAGLGLYLTFQIPPVGPPNASTWVMQVPFEILPSRTEGRGRSFAFVDTHDRDAPNQAVLRQTENVSADAFVVRISGDYSGSIMTPYGVTDALEPDMEAWLRGYLDSIGFQEGARALDNYGKHVDRVYLTNMGYAAVIAARVFAIAVCAVSILVAVAVFWSGRSRATLEA